jgi:hypothetical protein
MNNYQEAYELMSLASVEFLLNDTSVMSHLI